MVLSRADRRAARAPRAQLEFGEDAETALDLLELTELAWHDCYREVTPSDQVLEDLFVCAAGDLATLVRAARLAVLDWRDLRIWADEVRRR